MRVYKLQKYIIPGCLVLPMISRWILPSGIEDRLYLSILGISIFIPDLLYVFYISDHLLSNRPQRHISINRQRFLIVFSIVTLCYVYLQLAFKGIYYVNDLIINNLSFVWLSLLFLLFPMSKKQLLLTKPFMTIALLLICVEVIIFSLGLMVYTTAAGNDLQGQDYGGILRISTTIGAATGTALILGLLSAVVLTVYNWRGRVRLMLMTISTVGIFFTMSRGTSLVWSIFLCYYFYTNYIKYSSTKLKRKYTLIAVCCIGLFYLVGGFNPILNRVEHMQDSVDATAGRDSKMDKSLRMVEMSAPWGYGLGQVFPEKAIERTYKPPYLFAPHNGYALMAIELGYVGIVLFIIFVVFMMTGINYKNSLGFYIWLVWLINNNTESILLDSEAMALLMFGIMSITKYINPKGTKDSNEKKYLKSLQFE